MELWLVDSGAQPRSTSTPLHTPENCFRPIDPPEGGFSSIEDAEEYASDVSDISNTPCLELGAEAPRLRLPNRRLANGVKKVVAKQLPVNNFEKRFALLSLRLSTSSSSLDSGNCGKFSSPSSKASSEDSMQACAGSYHLSGDSVRSAYNLRRHSDSKQGKKLARAENKRSPSNRHVQRTPELSFAR